MRKLLFPVFLLLLLVLASVAIPTKAATINHVTIYSWYQDENSPYEEYIISRAKVGDYIKVELYISFFTSVSLSVKDPRGRSLVVKPTTACTTSPCTFWFNTTSQSGQYTLDFLIDGATHYYYYLPVDEWKILSYSVDLPLIQMKDSAGNTINVIKVPSSDYNGTLTITVESSLSQPFIVGVDEDYSAEIIGTSPVVYPHGKGQVTVKVPFIVNGKGYFTLGKVKYHWSAYPVNAYAFVYLSDVYYAIPADGFPFADFSVAGTLPSSVTIGSAVTITGANVSVTPASGYTRLGTGFYGPVALMFDGVPMIATMANGTVVIYNLSASSDISLSKFKGSLPTIGSHTMQFGVVPLNNIDNPVFLSGKSTTAAKSGSVTVAGGGTFSIAIKDPALSVGNPATLFVKWDRSSVASWLYNGDSIPISLDARVLIGSDVYNEVFFSLTGKNGTAVNATVKAPAVKLDYTSVLGSATCAVYSGSTQLATNSTGISYKFAGYHFTLYRDGKIWTPPATGIIISIYSDGGLIKTVNATSSDFYVYTKPSITAKAFKRLDPASVLKGSVSASSPVGNITEVALDLKVYATMPKDKAYIPSEYTGNIGVALVLNADVGTYKLYNSFNVVTDPVANSTDVVITWDDASKTVATISVNKKGTYVISYTANNGGAKYPDDFTIAYIQDMNKNNLTQIKTKLFVNPGYYTTIEWMGDNKIKIYVKTTSPFALVPGGRITLKVQPTMLQLVNYTKAQKITSFNDYEFYLDDGGYVIYKLPAAPAGTEQSITVNATATIPVDLSPVIAEYDFTHSVSQTFKITGGYAPAAVPGISTDMLIVLATIIVILVAIYIYIKK
ncbi:MAG: hypothetical protein ACP5KE_06535 [Candidatus Methanodesulfokora sp.]